MSTSIFTFDHTKPTLAEAVGVNKSFIDDLEEEIKVVMLDLNTDQDKKEMKECTQSQLVEAVLHEFSYSQLVLLSSFYIRSVVDKIEKKAISEYVKSKMTDMDGLPKELKDLLDRLSNEINNIDGGDDKE